jgi:putative hemolysin
VIGWRSAQTLAAGTTFTFSTGDLWMLIAIVLLLIICAFLAAAETGLTRMSRPRASALADDGSKRARTLVKLISKPEHFLNPLLLSLLLCQTGQSVLTTLLADDLFGGWGALIGFFFSIIVVFVFVEAIPKTWAIVNSDRAALFAAPPVAALSKFPPVAVVSRGLIGLGNVLLPGKGLKQGPFVSEGEFLAFADAALEGDVIEHEERKLIESIIEFGDTVAREVMVPRPDMVFVEHDHTVSKALDTAIEHGYSRLPVLDGKEDEGVVGLAYTKDLIKAEREGGGDRLVSTIVRTVHFVPENKLVNRLMREMQAQKFHLAIVADEYGAIAGLITLEDCLEELVGDIVDEYDTEDAEVEHLDDGEYLVDGGMNIDDLEDLLHVKIPEEGWDTIGGFVFGTLGHLPDVGDSIEYQGWKFGVEQVDGRRIRRVRVSVIPGWDPKDHDIDKDAAAKVIDADMPADST